MPKRNFVIFDGDTTAIEAEFRSQGCDFEKVITAEGAFFYCTEAAAEKVSFALTAAEVEHECGFETPLS